MVDSRRLLWVGTLLVGAVGVGLLLWQALLLIGPTRGAEPPATETAVLLPATPFAETAVVTPPDTPSPLTICLPEEPNTLFPLASLNQAAQHLQPALFEPLITQRRFGQQPHTLTKLPTLEAGDARFESVTVQEGDLVVDANMRLVPLSAGTPLQLPDGALLTYQQGTLDLPQMVVQFTLLPTTWADGTAVTAEDSVFAFKLASSPDIPSDKFIIERTARYEAIDAQTLRWTGLPGFYSRTYSSNVWAPLPRHLWQDRQPDEIPFLPDLNRQPVGNGPYRVSEWVEGSHIRLVANENYYLAAAALPREQTLLVRFIPDPRNLLNGIITGQCDLVTQDGVNPEQTNTILAAASNGLLTPHFQSGQVYELLVFGVNSTTDFGDGLGRPDWFEEATVRQAIAACIDRQTIATTLFADHSSLLNSYLPDEHPLRDSTLPPLDYNPEKGNSLLDEAGFFDSDGDGIREDGVSKRPFQISLGISTQTGNNQTLAQLLQQDLRRCGIDLTLDFYPPHEWFAAQESSPLFGRRFDMGHLAWPVGEEPLCFLFSGAEITGSPQSINPATQAAFGGWTGTNPTGWWLPEFDRACAEARRALPGTAVYRTQHHAAQRLFADNLPAIPLFLRFKLAISAPTLTGFTLDPTALSDLLDVAQFERVQDEP